jgi:hypothetical protein
MRSSELFMNNVPEGFGSTIKFEFIQFSVISIDSTNELKSQLIQSL